MLKIEKKKTPIKERDPLERIGDFMEVNSGYSLEEAKNEAARCLQCKNPSCIKGCPVGIDIPKFIKLILDENLEESFKTLKEYNFLPAVCGRVCPQEKQCEEKCVVGKMKEHEPVAIGRLERFTADWGLKNADDSLNNYTGISYQNDRKVAVIGSGPAGLTCAAELAKKGIKPEIFEALHLPGGVLVYGIPEFRLPKEIVRKEIEGLESLGVKIKTDMIIGKTIPMKKIIAEYDSVFIGTGAGTPKFLEVEGTDLNGVYSSSEFLTRINLMKAYNFPAYDTPVKTGKRVCVIGGGNVAMDCARSAKRLGADEVYIIYRRTESEAPARIEELHHALEEGINFLWLSNPVQYFGDSKGNLTKIKVQKMELGEPDSSGRRRPLPVENSEYCIEADLVIEAIGQSSNKVLFEGFPELRLNKWGYIEVSCSLRTSVEGVFAGGDIVTGAATVIEAMGAGKKAADEIEKYLLNKRNEGGIK